MNCKNCGSPIIGGEQVCEFCGTPINGGAASGNNAGFGGNTGSNDPFGGAPAQNNTQSAPTAQNFGFGDTTSSPFGSVQQTVEDYSNMSEEEQKAKLAADFGFGGGTASDMSTNAQQAAQGYSGMSEEEQKAKLAAEFGFGGDTQAAGGSTSDFSNDNYTQGDMSAGSDFDYTAGTEHITERVEAAKASRGSNENLNKIIMYAILGVVGVLVISIIIMVIAGAVSSSKDNPPENQDIVEPVDEPVDEPDEPVIEEPEYNEIDESMVDDIIAGNSEYTDFGIYVRNLNNDYEFGYSENRTFLASAMCQVVILDTLAREVDKKNININNEEFQFTYLPNGKEAPSSPGEDGSYLPLTKFVEDIAVYGDNNKSNHLVEYIAMINGTSNGFDVINSTLSQNGYRNTKINRKTFINPALIDESVSPNETSPKEIANIYENLINSEILGTKSYMKNIFKSVSGTGEPIGLKKYVPSYYSICNVNALNSQSTNNVALISDGDTEIVVAMLSETQESKTDIEDNDVRERIQARILEYILRTQFED